MKNVFQGQNVRVAVTFRDFNDGLIDPTAVTAYTQREADTAWTDVSGSVVHDSTGKYHVDIATEAKSGVYEWRFRGTGASANAIQDRFYVIPMAPGETAP